MAKTASERKVEQRKRQKESGIVKMEILVDQQELAMLKRNCILRRPSRQPYDINEYLTTLIRMDDRTLQQQLKALSEQCSKKCGEQLPVIECCLEGDSECWCSSQKLRLM
ncbi:TPA: hypothetical protein SLN72_000164 [Morganella morganii]|nr:hypothetical protein [Morganella morganii]